MDSSLLLLTAGHPFRAGYLSLTGGFGNTVHPYAPFLVEMRGQKEGFRCYRPLKTLVAQDVILRSLWGEVQETPDLATRLRSLGERAGSRAPVVSLLFPQ
jgi:hypothetical protein